MKKLIFLILLIFCTINLCAQSVSCGVISVYGSYRFAQEVNGRLF